MAPCLPQETSARECRLVSVTLKGTRSSANNTPYATTGTANAPAFLLIRTKPSRRGCGLDIFSVQERYGLVWVRLVDNGPLPLPEMREWEDPYYLNLIPDSVMINAAAGRQVEGFLDVS